MLPVKVLKYPWFTETLWTFTLMNGLMMQSLLSHITLTKNKVFFVFFYLTKKSKQKTFILLLKQSGQVRGLVL